MYANKSYLLDSEPQVSTDISKIQKPGKYTVVNLLYCIYTALLYSKQVFFSTMTRDRTIQRPFQIIRDSVNRLNTKWLEGRTKQLQTAAQSGTVTLGTHPFLYAPRVPLASSPRHSHHSIPPAPYFRPIQHVWGLGDSCKLPVSWGTEMGALWTNLVSCTFAKDMAANS